MTDLQQKESESFKKLLEEHRGLFEYRGNVPEYD